MRKERKWTNEELALLRTDLTSSEIARRTGRTTVSVAARRSKRRNGGKFVAGKRVSASPSAEAYQPSHEDYLSVIRRGPITLSALATTFGVTVPVVVAAVREIEKTHSISISGGLVSIDKPQAGFIPVDLLNSDKWVTIGLVADTHLGCDEERLDALHAVYDLFAAEGVQDVYHAGNMVDGYIPKINGASAHSTTIDDQTLYVIDNYPNRKGITTKFITGDDHEGWWIKTGFNWGNHMELTARAAGREDLVYIGHVEADIEFRKPGGSAVMKVQHPGGGSAYARSYTGQKTCESLQGGEKPAILVQGHYHVSNYMNERNIHVIGLPGFQDQTVFARKKRLRMEVGGCLLRFKQAEDGHITRLQTEFIMFFDRGFYRPFLRSDKRVKQGRLIVER